MAGLIFLWQNETSVTPEIIDYGVKPTILLADSFDIEFESTLLTDTVLELDIESVVPNLIVENTEGVFSDETTLVNDSTALVNDITATVGGSDLITSKLPISAIMKDVKPILI